MIYDIVPDRQLIYFEGGNLMQASESMDATMRIALRWANPLTGPEGTTVIENRTEPLGILTLEAIDLLEPHEEQLARDTAVIRARILDALGEHHARAVLEVQSEIPVEWQNFALLFSGTLYRNNLKGDISMPCLFYFKQENEWWLSYTGTTGSWSKFVRIVRVKEVSSR